MLCSLEYKKRDEEELHAFCKTLIHRLKKDWDVVIAITGEEGTGKSSLAIIMGTYMQDIAKIPKFSLEKNVLYNPKTLDIKDAVLKLVPRFGVIMMDEAIKSLYKMGFMSKAQQYINQLYTLCRKENKATLLCIPRFGDLNEFFRNHRTKIWLHIVARGEVMIFVRDWNPLVADPWHMRENIKKIGSKSRSMGMSKQEKITLLQQTSIYAGMFTFNPLPVDIEREYKKRAAEVKYNLDFDEVKGMARKYRDLAKKAITFLYSIDGWKRAELLKEFEGYITKGMLERFLEEEEVRPVDKTQPLNRKAV